MESIWCVIDGSPASADATERAIALSTRRRGELSFVGVVAPPRLGPPQPAVGYRIDRFLSVEHQLVLAERAAATAGIPASVRIDAGTHDSARLAGEAEAAGATTLVMPRSARSVLGKRRTWVEESTLEPPDGEQVALRPAAA